jgi:phospholipase C
VQWVPTIMDEMTAAGVSWGIYAAPKPAPPHKSSAFYVWAVCPYFADCLYTNEQQSIHPTQQITTDAANGTLPGYSLVMPAGGPTGGTSQHNQESMLVGDNYIGNIVKAVENGPEWNSTAIFITYDDCGCFYDHVAPPAGYGIRVPMVIVSPWAKPGYTDSTPASFASVTAFAEHVLGFSPLTSLDANAYDYSGAFDFTQTPQRPVMMSNHAIPRAEQAWLKAHPAQPDGT